MKKRLIFISAAILLTAAFVFSGYQLWNYFADERETEEQYTELAGLVVKPPTTPSATAPSGENPGATPAPEWTVFDQYGALFEQNPDMTGWIAIDGIGVNYPVMHTPDRPDYYLKRDFEKQSSKYGVPYAAENCSLDPQSDNVTIYGHHMKSGKMFGVLEEYKSADYWREHPIIRFDTRAGFGEYTIFAVFTVNPGDFPYHTFADAADAAEFDSYVKQCKALSFYDTGVTAKYGDKLITLSTCEHSGKDKRLVVVARKAADISALPPVPFTLPLQIRPLNLSPLPLQWIRR